MRALFKVCGASNLVWKITCLWTRRVQEGPERSNISTSVFFSSCSYIPSTNFETSLGDDQFLWLRDMTSWVADNVAGWQPWCYSTCFNRDKKKNLRIDDTKDLFMCYFTCQAEKNTNFLRLFFKFTWYLTLGKTIQDGEYVWWRHRLPVGPPLMKNYKPHLAEKIYIYIFALFFCLLLHRLALPINLPFHIFLQV